MKKILLFTLSSLMFSCVTVNPSILKPGNNEIPKRLHKLEIGKGETTVIRTESIKSVTVQKDYLTILERELEANVFDDSRKNWGYLEYKIVFNADNPTSKGGKYFIITNLTGWLSFILGYPVWEIEKTMEVEIGIYDKNETKLKKYNIVATSEPKVVTMYNMSTWTPDMRTWTPDRIAGVEVTRDIIEKFKLELENDIHYLNKELEAAGPLGQ